MYLACDDTHDHGLGWAHKHVMQAHRPEQAIGSGEAGVGMNQEGGTLHEGPQVNVHVPLLICQVPALTAWCPQSRLSSRKRNSSIHHS